MTKKKIPKKTEIPKKTGKKKPVKTSKREPKQVLTHARADAKHRAKSAKLGFFLAKFFLIFVILTAIVEILDLSVLTEWLAIVSAIPLGMVVAGSLVFVDGQIFAVTNSCTGLISASILAAVIFSLRKPELKEKVLIFIAGLTILLIVNIPRLMLVLWSASVGMDANLVHVFTWYVMSALILLIWYYGTKRIAKINDFSELL